MSDLVERLRKLADRERPYGSLPDTLDEAATAIEGLSVNMAYAARLLSEQTAKIERLRDALRVFTCDCEGKELCAKPDNCRNYVARAALEGR